MRNCIFFTLILLNLFFLSCEKKSHETVKIEINGKEYQFETALTKEERRKGLMFRKNLAKNGGMLFVFQEEMVLSFYMKNTLIPLDIAYINSKFEIIDIQNMKPLDESDITSAGPALYALEVNEGFYERQGIKVGDKIKILTPLPYISE
ncbi:MAG: DUF192 domain-containing protein [Spirochaetes bacterium]|nr:DUF192 domain-containing protein [Spirochaetota bacterium]